MANCVSLPEGYAAVLTSNMIFIFFYLLLLHHPHQGRHAHNTSQQPSQGTEAVSRRGRAAARVGAGIGGASVRVDLQAVYLKLQKMYIRG